MLLQLQKENYKPQQQRTMVSNPPPPTTFEVMALAAWGYTLESQQSNASTHEQLPIPETWTQSPGTSSNKFDKQALATAANLEPITLQQRLKGQLKWMNHIRLLHAVINSGATRSFI